MRFKVYGWTEDDVINYNEDFDKELSDALDDGEYTTPIEYANFIGSSNDPEEAMKMTDSRYYDISSVFDTEDKCWFN